jgi:hypothetical protein
MNLKKYFFYWAAAMVLLIALFAILGPKSKPIDLKSISFTSTESAELYFKNIRSFSYDRIENDKAKFILYRIKSREEDTTKLGINFLIVSNWLQDENYIIVETHPYDFLNNGLMVKNGDINDTIYKDGNDIEANYVFAAKFYEQLTSESNFYFTDTLGKIQELVISEQQQNSLKKSLKDYFKLVGKIR